MPKLTYLTRAGCPKVTWNISRRFSTSKPIKREVPVIKLDEFVPLNNSKETVTLPSTVNNNNTVSIETGSDNNNILINDSSFSFEFYYLLLQARLDNYFKEIDPVRTITTPHNPKHFIKEDNHGITNALEYLAKLVNDGTLDYTILSNILFKFSLIYGIYFISVLRAYDLSAVYNYLIILYIKRLSEIIDSVFYKRLLSRLNYIIKAYDDNKVKCITRYNIGIKNINRSYTHLKRINLIKIISSSINKLFINNSTRIKHDTKVKPLNKLIVNNKARGLHNTIDFLNHMGIIPRVYRVFMNNISIIPRRAVNLVYLDLTRSNGLFYSRGGNVVRVDVQRYFLALDLNDTALSFFTHEDIRWGSLIRFYLHGTEFTGVPVERGNQTPDNITQIVTIDTSFYLTYRHLLVTNNSPMPVRILFDLTELFLGSLNIGHTLGIDRAEWALDRLLTHITVDAVNAIRVVDIRFSHFISNNYFFYDALDPQANIFSMCNWFIDYPVWDELYVDGMLYRGMVLHHPNLEEYPDDVRSLPVTVHWLSRYRRSRLVTNGHNIQYYYSSSLTVNLLILRR